MKPRETLLTLLRRVHGGAFASRLLATSLDHHTSLDKSFITDGLYGTLRNYRYLEFCLKPHLARPDKLPTDVLLALQAASYEILFRATPRHAVVNEWVEIVKQKQPRLAGLVNAVLRKVEDVKTSEDVKYSVPEFLYQDWEALFADDASHVARSMNEPEPLWLYAYDARAQASLEAEGCEVLAGPLENTCAVKPSKALTQLAAYKEGFIQAQNPSSVWITSLLDPQPNERVLDLCSGNGIKAAQLSKAGSSVIAVEIDARKVAQAKQNLNRLHLKAQHITHDLTKPLELESATKVLLDAPCTGTGTLRGHPEIKLRLKPDDVQKLAALQKKLLTTTSSLVAPNGVLVYAVCALTKAEGVETVEWFLKENKRFSPQPFTCPLPNIGTEFGCYILPYEGLDGFFVAKLHSN
jgi:16S rRNA (cytosine967-C5)-methyltransferase